MRKILNITHNDLDGSAAGACIRLAHSKDHVRTTPSDVFGVARVLFKELTSTRRSYDRIILSDCSIKIPGDRCSYEDDYVRRFDPSVGEYIGLSEWDVINTYLPELISQYVANGGEFVVLDHHETALSMKEYYHTSLHDSSILEKEDYKGIPRAGSELAQRYYEQETAILSSGNPRIGYASAEIMELCGDLDCWRNPTGLAADLGLACELMDDPMTMIEQLTAIIKHRATYPGMTTLQGCVYTSSQISYYIDQAKNQLAGAIAKAKQTAITYPNNVTVVESGKFVSLVSHSIYTETEGIVVLTYPESPTKLSFRAHESNTHINLASFAREFGGGGHQFASGLKIPSGMTLEDIVSKLVKHAGNQSR